MAEDSHDEYAQDADWEPPTSEAPTSEAPTSEAPTSEAPTSEAPTPAASQSRARVTVDASVDATTPLLIDTGVDSRGISIGTQHERPDTGVDIETQVKPLTLTPKP